MVESESEEDVEKFISKCKIKFEFCEAIYENDLNMSRLKKVSVATNSYRAWCSGNA